MGQLESYLCLTVLPITLWKSCSKYSITYFFALNQIRFPPSRLFQHTVYGDCLCLTVSGWFMPVFSYHMRFKASIHPPPPCDNGNPDSLAQGCFSHLFKIDLSRSFAEMKCCLIPQQMKNIVSRTC